MSPDEPTTQPGRIADGLAAVRNAWRGLTSMRTALVLLFLLALAALPGALLPQRSLNAAKVDTYRADHPLWGRVFGALGMFDVFSSPWFAAIYLLLFVSLIGCLVPRSADYLRALRARPVGVPRKLARLPHHADAVIDADLDDVLDRARRVLRRWRSTELTETGGARAFSAERGYLREAGNLVFHLALLGLLITVALGKLYGYEGQVIVAADGSQFCNSGLLGYDTFRPGLRVDGTDLDPFCVSVDDFTATYRADGQPDSFSSAVRYQSGADLSTQDWKSYDLKVNDPLRLSGDRVYLLGHGYSPQFTVTYPDGTRRTGTIQWRPVDQASLLSEGATKFDPPGVTDEATRRTRQLAITGLLAPTAQLGDRGGAPVTSLFPAPVNPIVAVDVYRGDLGTDSGASQSIYQIDQSMVDQGKLRQVARGNLAVGDSMRLDDGTQVRFDGLGQWVSLQVSHDPAQLWVLVSAIALLAGLGASLIVRRRRCWVRVAERDDGTVRLELGGLARTDAAGYGEEFGRLTAAMLDGWPVDLPAADAGGGGTGGGGTGGGGTGEDPDGDEDSSEHAAQRVAVAKGS